MAMKAEHKGWLIGALIAAAVFYAIWNVPFLKNIFVKS